LTLPDVSVSLLAILISADHDFEKPKADPEVVAFYGRKK